MNAPARMPPTVLARLIGYEENVDAEWELRPGMPPETLRRPLAVNPARTSGISPFDLPNVAMYRLERWTRFHDIPRDHIVAEYRRE